MILLNDSLKHKTTVLNIRLDNYPSIEGLGQVKLTTLIEYSSFECDIKIHLHIDNERPFHDKFEQLLELNLILLEL